MLEIGIGLITFFVGVLQFIIGMMYERKRCQKIIYYAFQIKKDPNLIPISFCIAQKMTTEKMKKYLATTHNRGRKRP